MNKYAIIPIELYDYDSLTESYPVNIEMGKFQMLEYVTESDPTGEHWVIFEGEDSNKKCSKYISSILK